MKNKKGSVLLILITIIIILILALGIYIYYSHNNTASKVQSNSTSSNIQSNQTIPDTSNWQTYKDEVYGFEIKYPNNSTVSNVTLNYENTNGTSVYIKPPFSSGKTKLTDKTLELSLFYNKGITSEDIIQPGCNNTANNKTYTKVINGINFSVTNSGFDVTQGTPGINYFGSEADTEYCTSNKLITLRITYQLTYDKNSTLPDFDSNNESEVLNQMLYTFKFTN